MVTRTLVSAVAAAEGLLREQVGERGGVHRESADRRRSVYDRGSSNTGGTPRLRR